MDNQEKEERWKQHMIAMKKIEDEAKNYTLTDNEDRFIGMLAKIVNKQNNARYLLENLSNYEYNDLDRGIKYSLEYTSHCLQDILDELS